MSCSKCEIADNCPDAYTLIAPHCGNYNKKKERKEHNTMDKEAYIRAVLECVFSGFKDELIDVAVKQIMDYKEIRNDRQTTEINK